MSVQNTVIKRFYISGRVQGVGFRWSTQTEATRLGLIGWVRNLPDGRVEVLAAGPLKQMRQLEAWLGHGPPSARVDTVVAEVEGTPPEGGHFDIA